MICLTVLRRALKLYRDGKSVRQIAAMFKMPPATLLDAMRKSKSFKPRPRGRPKGWRPPVKPTPEDAAMRARTLAIIAAEDRRRELARMR